MNLLIGYVRGAERFNDAFGKALSWLTLSTVLTCFLVVVLRYAFSIGSICLQEAYVWQHAIVFMLGAGYTFLHAGHVRVDILYAKRSPKQKAAIDLFGTAFFLIPWLGILVYYGWPFVRLSWQIQESSSQAGGCPGFFLLKGVVMIFAALVLLQGLALAARSLLVLAGREDFAPRGSSH
jgi:TRAP-type mannitol/chloroaromatic compound transport system permease small subunit